MGIIQITGIGWQLISQGAGSRGCLKMRGQAGNDIFSKFRFPKVILGQKKILLPGAKRRIQDGGGGHLEFSGIGWIVHFLSDFDVFYM